MNPDATPAFEIPALVLSEHVIAHHVAPGTPYEDEPTQTVPAGWWVIGNNGDIENDFEIHIGTIEDARSNDVAEQVARLLAAALQEASNRGWRDQLTHRTPDDTRRGHPMISDAAAMREQIARTLHDANTGRIVPDDNDPTAYGRMADATLAAFADELDRLAEGGEMVFTAATAFDMDGASMLSGAMKALRARAHQLRSEIVGEDVNR